MLHLSRVRRLVQILSLVAVGCDAPGQEAVLIYQGQYDASAYGFGYGFTADSLVLREPDRIVELELDGTPRGTIFDQQFIKMAVGHGWVVWSDVVANGDGTFTARFTRRSASGVVEQAVWPSPGGGNVDVLLPTPEGIVIKETYSSQPGLWGATAIEPLALGETDIWPVVYDSGWLYATVNASSATGAGQIMRFRLDGSRKERLLPAGGPDGAMSFAVHGTRLVHTRYGYPAIQIYLRDLETGQQDEIGELSYGYVSAALAIDDAHVFAEGFRYDGDLERFLPVTGSSVARLDLVGDSLFWATQTYSENGSSSTFAIYRASPTGEPLASPTANDDSRPPFL